MTGAFAGITSACKIEEVILHAAGPVYEVALNFRVLAVETGVTYVYLGTDTPGQVWRSGDNGLTWEMVQELSPGGVWRIVKATDLIALVGDIFVAGTMRAYKSVDGAEWSEVESFGVEYQPQCTVKLSSGTILTGSRPNGIIWQSTDGVVWSQLYDLEDRVGVNIQIQGLIEASDGSITACVYIESTDFVQFWRSTNGGVTWSYVNTIGAKSYVYENGYVLLKNGWLLVVASWIEPGVEKTYVYRSTDNGASWARIAEINDRQYMCLRELEDGTVLTGGSMNGSDDAVMGRSSDFGTTWTETMIQDATGEYYTCYDSIELPNGTVLAAFTLDTLPPTIWRSTDGGVTWEFAFSFSGSISSANTFLVA